MPFLRFHNTGLNTDAIVRWHDDDEQDTLSVFLCGAGTLRVHGEQRVAMLRSLAGISEDLAADDVCASEPTWQDACKALLTMTRHIPFLRTDDDESLTPQPGCGCPLEVTSGQTSCISGSGDSHCWAYLGTIGPYVHCGAVYPKTNAPGCPPARARRSL